VTSSFAAGDGDHAAARRHRARNTRVIAAIVFLLLVLGAMSLRSGTALGRHASDPDDPRAFRFMRTTANGGPVTWDPCLPIDLVVNNASAPPGSDTLVAEAAERVSEASGLTVRVLGPSTERPDPDRTARELQQGRPGGVHAPVLVAWTTPAEVAGLEGGVVGLGGPVTRFGSAADRTKYVGGTVYLDGPQVQGILRRPGGHERARAIVMHELAHLVGLDHVDNTSQVMAPSASAVTEFGAGDRAGLERLGSGGCPYETGPAVRAAS
jgi:hypothetical protein